MSCPEYENDLMEFARGGVLEGGGRRALQLHLEHCTGCAARLDEQRALQAAMVRLAEEPPLPDDEIEAHVLAEFDRAFPLGAAGLMGRRKAPAPPWLAPALSGGAGGSPALRPDESPRTRRDGGVFTFGGATERDRMGARWIAVVGLAAALVLVAILNLGYLPERHPLPYGRGSETQARGVDAAPTEATPFLTIPYTIPLAPEERVEMVRMRIPVAALLAAGYHLQVADPSMAIDADVLISQDGRARAIRPLTVSMSD